MSSVEKLTDNQLKVLFVYEEMDLSKTPKTKTERYKLIGTQLGVPQATVRTWVTRYYENYLNFKKELPKKTQKKNSKKLNLEGLTELELKYLKARLCGFSKDEAKDQAGYSENTKAADIEKQPNLAKTLEEIRKEFLIDERYGIEAIVEEIKRVKARAEEYKAEDATTQSFVTSDGKKVVRTIRKTNMFHIELAAMKLITSIFGYDARTVLQKQQRVGGDSGGIVYIEEEEIK
ncbi:MAG: hypothetical protein ACRC8M_00345 [Cetobacterium sp.]|uniref:hypothetical protein n=1 Tax=Cetobacterium sp. TaxID=2071632 RepID=UPI003F2B3FB3